MATGHSRDDADDVFDEDADERTLQQKDWTKKQADLFKEDFRRGVVEGEECSVQPGFDLGFTQAVGLYRDLGGVRGQVSALLAVSRLQYAQVSLGEATRDELQSMLKEVEDFEKDLKKSVKSKCTELVVVQSDPPRDVAVCSCDGQKVCGLCYEDSRVMASDLGLDDVMEAPEAHSVTSDTARDGVTSGLSLQQISDSYAELLDQARTKIAQFENRLAKIMKESVGVELK